MSEEWREILEFGNDYAVSDLGRMRSLKQEKRRKLDGIFIIKIVDNSLGYMRCCLCRDGKQSTHPIHRLVAKAFIPNPTNRKYVNHKDGDKKNNRVDNLEWVTSGENQSHAYKTGLRNRPDGTQNGRCKLTEDQVREIRTRSPHESPTTLGREFGVTHTTIRGIRKKRLWQHLT